MGMINIYVGLYEFRFLTMSILSFPYILVNILSPFLICCCISFLSESEITRPRVGGFKVEGLRIVGRLRGGGRGGRDFKGGDESTVRSIGLLGLFLAGTDAADAADAAALAARAREAFLLAAIASSFFFFSIASIAAAWEAAAEDTARRFLRSMSQQRY